MKVKVIGIKKVDYINKSGRHVEGEEIHCCFEAQNVQGLCVDKFYFNIGFPNLDKVKTGKEFNIYFNQFGKPDFLTEI